MLPQRSQHMDIRTFHLSTTTTTPKSVMHFGCGFSLIFFFRTRVCVHNVHRNNCFVCWRSTKPPHKAYDYCADMRIKIVVKMNGLRYGGRGQRSTYFAQSLHRFYSLIPFDRCDSIVMQTIYKSIFKHSVKCMGVCVCVEH